MHGCSELLPQILQTCCLETIETAPEMVWLIMFSIETKPPLAQHAGIRTFLMG